MNGPLLSREQLKNALERLAHHLDRRGVHAELYLFGGGAMVLADNARDATMDLDAAIRRHHGSVVAEARVVAAELGLPSWWLNEQATSTPLLGRTLTPQRSWIARASRLSPRRPAISWP